MMAGCALPRGEGLSSEISACALAHCEFSWSVSGLQQFWWLQLVLRSLGSAAVVQAGCAPHPRPCSTKAELGAELLCVPICLRHRWELQFGSAFNCELVCHGTAHRAVGSQGMGATRGRGNW